MSQQTSNRFSRGGMARWSVYHPIGVIMIALAIVVIGTLSYKGLAVNLLPRVSKPEIRVRILQTGVPARIMEDKVTRQLEEQLAITEDAISVESTSSEGRSSVNLTFEYGKDIEVALRDASTRLDRAKRFLPKDADQPIIYKRDPMQLPALELMVSSTALNTIKLRTWVEVDLSKWLLTLPGVTAVEVGGGKIREIQVLPDQQKLSSRNLSFDDLVDAIKNSNIEVATGRIHIGNKEISSRATSNIKSIKQLKNLPIMLADGSYIRLKEVARISDSHEDEKLRVRLNDVPGIKVSIQKRPTANTIKVVDAIKAKLDELEKNSSIPAHIKIETADDQSVYIRAALNNAKWAASLGAGLAMIIVFVFLGDIRRTLIIGSAIPIAIVVTFLLMNTLGLTLNIMTLGGLAVGIGMLVDNTIVMLENIHRQQQMEADAQKAAVTAAGEINSAIVASTTTNLAAIIPFLFIGGFLGLMFKELIITISSAMVASMIVALTLVPALAAKLRPMNIHSGRTEFGRLMHRLQIAFADQIKSLLVNTGAKIALVSTMVILLVIVMFSFGSNKKQDLFPSFDTGVVKMIIIADTGTTLDETDQNIKTMEVMIRKTLPNVKNIFTIAGGFIYGRSTFESHNRGFVVVELDKSAKRKIATTEWIVKDRKSTRLNSSHTDISRMPSSA